MTVIEKPLVPVGYEQLTGLSAVKGLANVPNNICAIWLQAESQQVRVRWGADPTATVGQPLPVGSGGVKLNISSKQATLARFIESAASAKLNVTYFRADDVI